MTKQVKVSCGPILSGSPSQSAVAHDLVLVSVKGDIILSSLAGPGVRENLLLSE